MNPCLEISIARENSRHVEVVVGNDLLKLWVEWTTVTNAGCAAKGGYVKTKAS